jgi:hypothetical protein
MKAALLKLGLLTVALCSPALACESEDTDLGQFKRTISEGSIDETALVALSFPLEVDNWPISDVALRIGTGEEFIVYAPLAHNIDQSDGIAKFEVARKSLARAEVIIVYHPGVGEDGSVIMCDKRFYVELESGHVEEFGT